VDQSRTDKRAFSIQRPRLCFTNKDVQVVNVAAPTNVETESQLRNPILTKTSLDDATLSPFTPPIPDPKDSQLPPGKSDALVPANNGGSVAAIAANPIVQKFLQRSVNLAVDDLFASGTVQQLMDSSLNQVTSFDTAYTGSYNSETYDISKSLDPENLEKPNLKEAAKDDGPRLSRSRTCHQKSSIGVVLGSIWIRTSTLKVAEASSITSGRLEVITSFIFYPASWLTKVGLRYGTEANLQWSPTGGWKFNVTSVKAVPENALIFDLCKQGNVSAVQLLLSRGDASVKDTSPKGWTPLHVSRFSVCDSGQLSLIYNSLLPPRAMWTCVLL
jgi:hypothetical protein